MSPNPFLRWPWVVLTRGVAVVSGPIAVVMQAYELYSGRSITRPSYLFGIWVAFAASAFLAWLQEHQNVQIERKAKEKAEKDLADTSPKLFLEFSKEHANDFTTYSGLFVRNAGKKPALQNRIILHKNEWFRFGLREHAHRTHRL